MFIPLTDVNVHVYMYMCVCLMSDRNCRELRRKEQTGNPDIKYGNIEYQ